MNEHHYTNFPDIWKDIGFDRSKNILYKVNHNDASWEKLFDLTAFNTADKIFVIDQESHSHKFINHDSRIHVWDSTVSAHPRINTFLFWFDWVREVEKHMQLCKNLLPANTKQPKIAFDALLGQLRSHKRFVLTNIETTKPNQFITGACKSHINVLPEGYVSGGSYETGENRLKFNNTQDANVDCFVPYKIYNDTWYTLVCETRGTGENYFFTEKLARPLIAERLFVLFGQYKQLHNLKKLGFKTFDGIIDESYDLERNDNNRYHKAWQQIEYLLQQDPVKIYKKCSPILKHNCNLIKQTNWTDILTNQMIRKSF